MRTYLIAVTTTPLMRRIFWFFAAILSLASNAAMAQAPVSITLEPTENGVVFVMHNNTTNTLSVLRWDTPLAVELTQDVFEVSPATTVGTHTGAHSSAIQYTGRLLKRGAPQPEDFINIGAGKSHRSTVTISDYYQIPKRGTYSVGFSGNIKVQALHSHNARNTSSTLTAFNTKSIPVLTTLTPSPRASAFARHALAAGFNSCSAAQQAMLAGDLDASELITRNAHMALTDLPENERAGSPRYLHWFGTYEASRYSQVVATYRNAEQVMANGSIQFNCDCDASSYAYVFPLDPYKVYLCNFYWTAPQTGTDSRAGTILHEISHFPDVGNTNDSTYGAERTASLAVLNPASAVNNADSIEYFAENTPYREISAGPSTPTQATQYVRLQAGDVSSAFLQAYDYSYYQLSDARSVELTTISGDADLFIYADDARSQLVCDSQLTAAIDQCDLNSTSTVYIEVLAYNADTQYSITATGTEEDTQSNPETIVIPTGDPASNATCEDTGIVGDGWGWNGTESCTIAITDAPLTDGETPDSSVSDALCVDSNGDGFGWNGTETCLPSAPDTTEPTTESACVDIDGDGWGWNGTATCLITPTVCIDTDGDGWGWDGTGTCMPEATTAQEDTLASTNTDAVCIDSNGDGYGWNGTTTCTLPVTESASIDSNTTCIDSDGDGWGWDGSESCLKSQLRGN